MILLYNKHLIKSDKYGALYYRYPDRLGMIMLSQPQTLACKEFMEQDIISNIVNEDVREQVIIALKDFSYELSHTS